MGSTVIVGDVGGTHARWAVYDGQLGPVTVQRTADTGNAAEALKEYLEQYPCTPGAVCLGVAGPVSEGRATLTNVDWHASEDDIPWPTKILNDLESVAHAIPSLGDRDVSLLSGSVGTGRKLVIGVGTGFGGAIFDEGTVFPMEPGHQPLAAYDAESEEFLRQFQKIVTNPTVEDVVSGRGFELVVGLKDVDFGRTPAGKAVLDGWKTNGELAWIRRHFLRYFGHTVGRLAAETHAKGGIFLTGGVVAHWIDQLSDDLFLSAVGDAYSRSGVRGVPSIQVITHEFAALLGAGSVGQALIVQ